MLGRGHRHWRRHRPGSLASPKVGRQLVAGVVTVVSVWPGASIPRPPPRLMRAVASHDRGRRDRRPSHLPAGERGAGGGPPSRGRSSRGSGLTHRQLAARSRCAKPVAGPVRRTNSRSASHGAGRPSLVSGLRASIPVMSSDDLRIPVALRDGRSRSSMSPMRLAGSISMRSTACSPEGSWRGWRASGHRRSCVVTRGSGRRERSTRSAR